MSTMIFYSKNLNEMIEILDTIRYENSNSLNGLLVKESAIGCNENSIG
jgi:hypothetical protein